MVAVVGVMLFVNRQFANAIEYFLYWILTFPILIYTARYGVRYGILTSVCMLLLSLMISSPTTIFYLFCCVVVGIVYGEGVRRKWRHGILLLFTGICTLLSYLVTTMFFAAMFGYSMADDVAMAHAVLNLMHVNMQTLNMQWIVIGIAVLTTILVAGMQTLCIHLLAQMLLPRLKIETIPLKPMQTIHVAKCWGIIIIIIWIFFLGRNVLKLNQEISSIRYILFICSYVFAVCYGVFACIVWTMLKWKKGFIFLVMLCAFLPYVQTLLACIGVFDMLFTMHERLK